MKTQIREGRLIGKIKQKECLNRFHIPHLFQKSKIVFLLFIQFKFHCFIYYFIIKIKLEYVFQSIRWHCFDCWRHFNSCNRDEFINCTNKFMYLYYFCLYFSFFAYFLGKIMWKTTFLLPVSLVLQNKFYVLHLHSQVNSLQWRCLIEF